MSSPRRRFFAPEVIQTSEMDCGPAALKCLLEGLGVPVSYGRLREACQTDVDGTSIDTLEEIARQLGLDAEQVMVPADHVLLPSGACLPALVVVSLPNGNTHFVVLWRRSGGWVQMMDPGGGRRYARVAEVEAQLFRHTVEVPCEGWLEWASSADFTAPLAERCALLGIDPAPQLARSTAVASWRGPATLDAALRLVASLVGAGAVSRGEQAGALVTTLSECALAAPAEDVTLIPERMWTVRPAADAETLRLRGAVLLRVRGLIPKAAGDAELPLDLKAALNEPSPRTATLLWGLMRRAGHASLFGALLAAVVMGGLVTSEVLLLRSLIDLSARLGIRGQRLGALSFVLGFGALLLVMEGALSGLLRRAGRQLELRLRVALLEKLPRLGDRYFHSRLISDMAHRAHSVASIRGLPPLLLELVRTGSEVAFVVAALVWIDPATLPLALAIGVLVVGAPLLAQPVLAERELRQRTQSGALLRYYLDALLGLVPVRAHGAERIVRGEHEELLVRWGESGLSMQRTANAVDLLSLAAATGLSALLLVRHLGAHDLGQALLLSYLCLTLPALGERQAQLVRQLPGLKNAALRLFEPLSAPSEGQTETSATAAAPADPAAPVATAGALASLRGLRIELTEVSVRAGGHALLEDVTLSLDAGEEIAIVGPSGAGKSTLVGLLLGWHRAATGHIAVDGAALDGDGLAALRRQTAWVDPEVLLWNRSLLDNLRYGSPQGGVEALPAVIEAAALRSVLERLPEGIHTALGEGGALVSGGEGQRVRLGRGLFRKGARLVLLDEPFRGLDRARRRQLLEQARAHFRGATLLFVSHDVSEALSFGRVLVIDGGRVVEDGAPSALAARTDSRYRALLDADHEVREGLWGGDRWRRLRVERGQVHEVAAAASGTEPA